MNKKGLMITRKIREKVCLDCGKQHERKLSHYCEECFQALLKDKVKNS